MPNNNYNYGASYIMNSSNTSVDDPMDFDMSNTGNNELQVDMPKKQSKPTVEASLFKMADEKDY